MKTNKLRILFISTLETHPWGGCEELWSLAAIELAKEGHDIAVSLKAWPEEHPRLNQLRTAGCQIVKRKDRTKLSYATRLIGKIRRGGKSGKTEWLERLCSKFRPHLVCFSDGTTITRAGWMKKLIELQIPFVNIAQANAEAFWPQDWKAEQLRMVALGAQRMFFVSEENRRLFEDQIAQPLSNSEVVWNPFQVPFHSELDWPDTSKTLKLALVGRLEIFPKGHDLLFRVLSSPKWRERNFEVHLFGNGSNAKSIQRLIETYNLEKQVFIRGYTNNVLNIWKKCHALVLPSRHEGMPLAIIEAMLCERPVITTDVAGNASLIEHGVNGFVAESPSPAALGRAMEAAWQARSRWQSIGKAAGECSRQYIPANPPREFAKKLVMIAQELESLH